jgi:hypothetical protein
MNDEYDDEMYMKQANKFSPICLLIIHNLSFIIKKILR